MEPFPQIIFLIGIALIFGTSYLRRLDQRVANGLVGLGGVLVGLAFLFASMEWKAHLLFLLGLLFLFPLRVSFWSQPGSSSKKGRGSMVLAGAVCMSAGILMTHLGG